MSFDFKLQPSLAEGRSCLIYGLFDPRSKELRYVGQSAYGLSRAYAHFRWKSHLNKNTHKNAWIKSLLRSALEPEVDILHYSTLADFDEDEAWNITYWRSLGCRLTNQLPGGRSTRGYKHTQQARKHMSDGQKRRKRSEEEIERFSSFCRGIKLTEEHKEKIRNSLLGLKRSEETKRKISQVKRGATKATKQKMSLQRIGNVWMYDLKFISHLVPASEVEKCKLLGWSFGRGPTLTKRGCTA